MYAASLAAAWALATASVTVELAGFRVRATEVQELVVAETLLLEVAASAGVFVEDNEACGILLQGDWVFIWWRHHRTFAPPLPWLEVESLDGPLHALLLRAMVGLLEQ
jgi:hypothetical protein